MSLLSVRDLSLHLGGTPLLRDVSLDVDAGQIVGLVGESGSGKSLTALALMQLAPARSAVTGAAQFDGTDLLTRSEPQMCRLRGAEIGMVFQEPMTSLNPVQTIGRQVAETLVIHGAAARREAETRARAVLDRVGLQDFGMDRYPHELSGGQRQRVAIAMAIALRPKLLIADEPTTALDVTTQAQILDLLRGLVAEDGMALLLITHDLAVVSGMADRVAVMQAGQVVEAGPTAEVFRDRRHPYTRALFAASAHVPVRAAPPAGDAPVLEVRDVLRTYPLPRKGLFRPAGALRAVDGVSLTVARGESVGLVGESGCGKSTLTRAILGLDPLQGGEVRINGMPLPAHGETPPALRRRMQVVFQDPYGSFNPRHKVGRLVAEPFHLLPSPPPDAKAAVIEALEAVGLTEGDAGKYIHEFSGGQRQRIAIARALLIRPDLIVLDEAVSALDVRVRAQILDLLSDLQARFGLSYLFISHDLGVVRAITDRVLVMRAGRIVEQGPTARVLEAPDHPYTRALIAAAPRLPSSATA